MIQFSQFLDSFILAQNNNFQFNYTTFLNLHPIQIILPMNHLPVAFLTILALVEVIYSTSICPSGTIEYGPYAALPAEELQWKSKSSDIFYIITNQSNLFTLNCHKIVDQSSAINPTIQIQNLSIAAQQSWLISAVSEKGNCIGVTVPDKFITFNTASGNFTQGQSLNISSYSQYTIQYTLNDNCSIIKVLLTDSDGAALVKVFREGVEDTSLVLPQETLFDSDFNYAIDGIGNFYSYKVQSKSYVAQQYQNLRSTPVLINQCTKHAAVITFSKDSTGYSLLVIDPLNPSNFFSKTLTAGTDYTAEELQAFTSETGSIMLKSISGLEYYVTIGVQNSLLVGTEYTLQNTTYKQYFGSESTVSISNDIIFVYSLKHIAYFQAYKGKIYHLGTIETNIEEKLGNYSALLSSKELSFILAVFSPGSMDTCEPVPASNTTNTTNTTIPTINEDETKPPNAVDPESGGIIKCPDSCAACVSAQNCTICKIGYTLDEELAKCVFCEGCKSCNAKAPQICYNCFAPEVLEKQTMTCILPQCVTENCLQCDITGTCIKCLQGFSLVDSSCRKCSKPGCKSCSQGVDLCDSNSCMNGYVFYSNPNSGKSGCQPCVSGCDGCESYDLSACITCTNGYYPKADEDNITRCQTCFENCKLCKSATECKKCVTGYVPSEDLTKCELKCHQSCLTCEVTAAAKCLTCYAGSTFDPNQKSCSVDLSCNLTASCKICDSGYILSNGNCFQCNVKDPQCIVCQSTDLAVCAKCLTGYYLKSGNCNKCPQNCTACVGQAACSKCEDGLYLVTSDGSDTGICQTCDVECKTCSGTSGTCTGCFNKYVLEGSKCISVNRAVLSIVLQANVANIVEFMDDLIDWFVKTINSGKPAGADDITARQVAISKIKKYGSSILDALISSGSAAGANSASSALGSAINSGVAIGGYSIISGSVSAEVEPTTENLQNGTNNTLAIVLGVVIPIVLLIVTGYVIVMCKRRQQRKELERYMDPIQEHEVSHHSKDSVSIKQFSYESSFHKNNDHVNDHDLHHIDQIDLHIDHHQEHRLHQNHEVPHYSSESSQKKNSNQ